MRPAVQVSVRRAELSGWHRGWRAVVRRRRAPRHVELVHLALQALHDEQELALQLRRGDGRAAVSRRASTSAAVWALARALLLRRAADAAQL
eukprot:5845030-Pleurochrysis_carterae.AAC.6